MKKIKLKIVPEPQDGKVTVFVKPNNDDKRPFVVGSGSYKFACGFCDHILARGVEFKQVQNLAFKCPRCSKYNISNNPTPREHS
ncbi:hypothetical protein [Paenibacillus sp. S29]|uniref:hypothetical protein n=1 Tax=Paenibacillus sp. S29 TaxID=3394611 RepID=UPI0039BF3971